MISLTILFVSLTIKNSVGNVTEILSMLDKDTHTRQEIAENYGYLVEKWGEWTVIGHDGSAFEVAFINIGAALFSGLMKTYLVLTIISFSTAIIVGKVLFPKLSTYYKDHNQDMVNLATLETQSEIKKLKKNKDKDKDKEKEWF